MPGDGQSGLDRLVGFAGHVLAPTGVLTAVLYYFGYLHEKQFFEYFGVDLGSIGFSTTDYLLRGAGSLFSPLATVVVAGSLAVIAHHLLAFLLDQLSATWRRTVWVSLAVLALVLLVAGVVGLRHRGQVVPTPLLGDALVAATALGGGALLLEYVTESARTHEAVPERWAAILTSTRNVRRALSVGLALIAAFWATATIAHRHGIESARAVEVTLPIRSQAIVYSRDRLQIAGPGVVRTEVGGRDSAFRYRYNGLRTLVHTRDHWFLLPAGWTRHNGASVVMLPDAQRDIRVDLAP
ncbi:hypothetical protein DPM19_31165 [Actinomadura craniellae]|uniref:Uncharacterized protein n=1 Tax=Actinomadura craniellae TaxID=2231787 RepID=A0A365GWM4_9ACTN|nr:hypothetical protein [Actinomadura craniellae]RAY11221.1 hypothetical protein DPM19_31165 [Actinomadura craniellae]